ncbi:MAG: AAA family ATPase, partial [Myxococcales bacterium]|nr:AAA family ATPase [Myxococcales bacterium]
RAARRLAEATSQEASTVHRLLEYNPAEGGFRKGEDDPLEGGVVIVDEASMLDQPLFVALLRALVPGTRLVLVGDADQLPSVGPGNVLADLIASDVVPVVRLREIFRQAELSAIVVAAHHILAGRVPQAPPPGAESDFYVVEARDGAHAAELVVQLVQSRVPAKFGLRPDEIQVLTPMHRGACGAEKLNALLQAALNPGGAPVGKAGALRVGDKVMQRRNDYEREVFNGDVGQIMGRAGDQIEVAFDGRCVRYPGDGLEALQPAYACTIHKSQGSEYPAVVIPIATQHTIMLQRHLIYTAVTRARRYVVLVGSRTALERAIKTDARRRRYGLLRERLEGMGI